MDELITYNTALKTYNKLYFERSTQSDTTSVTDSETTLFENSDTVPFLVIGNIDLSNIASGDTFVFKRYIKNIDGGTYKTESVITLTDAQSPQVIYFNSICNIYGVKITGQRTGGSNRNFIHEWFIKKV